MTVSALVVTCEHAGNHVPAAYRHLFVSRRARLALASHRGYDPGARQVAREVAHLLLAPLVTNPTTRLLVETNRSIGHPRVFSEFSSVLDRAARAQVLARHYLPHRARVQSSIDSAPDGFVLHLAIHSFTPVLAGKMRRTDIGLLCDPKRPGERQLCKAWQRELRMTTRWVVRRNDPYRGSSDGLTTTLRTRFPRRRYLGLEVEINQRLFTTQRAAHRIAGTLVATLVAALGMPVHGSLATLLGSR
jgi:predicted N-formylglutamate amidohydrolase